MWILFISPWESRTNKWEAKIFPDQKSAEEYIHNADLTKEHYYSPVDGIVELLQKEFEKED